MKRPNTGVTIRTVDPDPASAPLPEPPPPGCRVCGHYRHAHSDDYWMHHHYPTRCMRCNCSAYTEPQTRSTPDQVEVRAAT